MVVRDVTNIVYVTVTSNNYYSMISYAVAAVDDILYVAALLNTEGSNTFYLNVTAINGSSGNTEWSYQSTGTSNSTYISILVGKCLIL
jgi:hypothetical protein